jgi:copper chaperone CopZ
MTIAIDGMSCGHCVAAVREALGAVSGVTVEAVQVGEATVAFDPARATPPAIAAAVTDAGYAVRATAAAA